MNSITYEQFYKTIKTTIDATRYDGLCERFNDTWKITKSAKDKLDEASKMFEGITNIDELSKADKNKLLKLNNTYYSRKREAIKATVELATEAYPQFYDTVFSRMDEKDKENNANKEELTAIIVCNFITAVTTRPTEATFLNDIDNTIIDNIADTALYYYRNNSFPERKINNFISVMAKENIENITTTRPSELTRPTDKRNNVTFFGDVFSESGKQDIRLESTKSKKEMTTTVSVDYSKLPANIAYKRLDGMVGDVHTAILSNWYKGNEYITKDMIYFAMTGNRKTNLSKDGTMSKLIDDAIDLLLFTPVTIDVTDENDSYGLNLENTIIKQTIVSGKVIQGKLNGNVVSCIQVFEEPVFGKLARLKNQISRIDIKILDTPINKTQTNILTQNYLIRRIDSMKRNPKLSRIILFSSLFGNIGLDPNERMKISRLKNAIYKMLPYWKQKGFIKGFKESKDGSKIEITLHEIIDSQSLHQG